MIPPGAYLADTSAFTRVAPHSAASREYLDELAEKYLLAACVVVVLEIRRSARDPAVYAELMATRADLLIPLPVTAEVEARALEVQALMAERGLWRAAGPADRLIAATAEIYGATVLHYDKNYDAIAACTGQPAEWIAPRGSII